MPISELSVNNKCNLIIWSGKPAVFPQRNHMQLKEFSWGKTQQ